MGKLPGDLVRPGRTLIETHISWVFLDPSDVWKVKKPVDFGFLDFRSLEQRKAACESELLLNRRLAQDTYLGVVPVTEHAGKLELGGAGPPVDWAVHMRRLPDHARADRRLEAGELTSQAIDQIAERLVRFHTEAEPAPLASASAITELVIQNVRENFGQTRTLIEQHLGGSQARELEAWQVQFFTTHEKLLHARAAAGKIRDGHGDLRLEHIYLAPEGDITIIDCIEFNERFRIADVCCDLAFLSMDLTFHGRIDLAERLLAVYARETGDYDLYRLVNFFESYRAHVRAKVALLLAGDEAAPAGLRDAAKGQARRYFLLALAKERSPVVSPRVVAVGGPIAAGKSTIAQLIGSKLGAPVVESDRTRKFLAGVAPAESLASPHFAEAYAPARTEQVYEEMWRRADAVLCSGRSIVLDASFRSRKHRRAARELAQRHGLPFHFVECQADEEKLRERLRARHEKLGEVSDARDDLLDDFLARWEPVDELSRGEHLMVDTRRPLETTVEALASALPFWPTHL